MSREEKAHRLKQGIPALPRGGERDTSRETRSTRHPAQLPAETPQPPRRRKRRATARIVYTNLELDPDMLEAMGRGYLALAQKIRRSRPPGRPRKEHLNRAMELYLAGVRGSRLYTASIPGFASMNRYRRKDEKRRLDDGIQKRLKRAGIEPPTNSA